MMFETLENRALLSAAWDTSVSFSGGVLTVNGSHKGDKIVLSESSGKKVNLTLNGKSASYNSVKKVVVKGGNGAEYVDASKMRMGVLLIGSNQHDTLIGGCGS